MPITCPQCKTTYQVPDDKIGAKGRQVKCITCKHVWHARVDPPKPVAKPAVAAAAREVYKPTDRDTSSASPPPPSPTQVPARNFEEPVVEEAEVANATPTIETPLPPAAPVVQEGFDEDLDVVEDGETGVVDFAEATAVAEAPAANAMSDESADIIANVSQAMIEIEGQAKAPKAAASSPVVAPEVKVRKPDHTFENLAGLAAVAAAITMLFAVVLFREPIVRAVPETARLYNLAGMDVNLRGLEFANISTSSDFENGVPVLMVSGTIVNVSSAAVGLPSVRLALRTARGQEVYAWSYKPSVKRLASGEEVNFNTRVASPPEGAADIQMRFIGIDQASAQ